MDIPDEQLIARFQGQNDLTAVEVLLRRYQDQVFGFLMTMLKETHDAEDVLQETFVRAIRGLASYREQQHFRAWIFRIARNEAVTLIRKRSRVTVQEDPYRDSGACEADSSALPVEVMEKREVVERLRLAVGQLPEAEREVVLLRLKSGVSFKEIAKITGASLNTVLGRMHNAKKRLKREFLTDLPA